MSYARIYALCSRVNDSGRNTPARRPSGRVCASTPASTMITQLERFAGFCAADATRRLACFAIAFGICGTLSLIYRPLKVTTENSGLPHRHLLEHWALAIPLVRH